MIKIVKIIFIKIKKLCNKPIVNKEEGENKNVEINKSKEAKPEKNCLKNQYKLMENHITKIRKLLKN